MSEIPILTDPVKHFSDEVETGHVRAHKETFTYPLHYIGKGLYERDQFILEAKRLGVNRAFPFNMIRKFEFGDRILLGEWKRYQKPTGIATVFGYFYVDRLVLEPEITEIIKPYLNIVGEYRGDEDEKDDVERKCGSYTIGGGYTVTNTLHQIIQFIEEACKDRGDNPFRHRYFLSGQYSNLPNEITIRPISFSRSYLYVKLPERINFTARLGGIAEVQYIYNYTRKMYASKVK